MLNRFYGGMSPVAQVILSVALMLFSGFAMTRLTRLLKLPNVSAYILAGVLMGPYALDLIPRGMVQNMDFLSDIALAFIAFSAGEFFRVSTLRQNGMKVVLITVLEACMASLMVFVLCAVFLKLSLAFSIVLAALAAATAPASTLMTIRQTGSKGDFVDTLLQVVVLDDVVGLLEYSVTISIAVALVSGGDKGFDWMDVLSPLAVNAGVLILGGFFGFILKWLMPVKRSTDNRLIISVSLLFAFCGICAILNVSPLLGCMSMGMIYINITDDDKLFKQLNYFSPPILLLFFVRSGLGFDLGTLTNSSALVGHTPLLLIGILYFFVRILGKYLGAFWGCLITGKDRLVRDYLGLALIPQAGVAIGLAALGERAIGGEGGRALNTIILASSVLYELIGPACAKLSLYLSKSYAFDAPPSISPAIPRSRLETLLDRVAALQKDLPPHEETSPEEQAFLDAAEEQLYGIGPIRNHHLQQKHRRFHAS